jgi:hydroxymethylglutaryl-CoA synthase
MANTYDFYKPKLDSEYPEVDGPASTTTYVDALDHAYSTYRTKVAKFQKLHGSASGYSNGHANGHSNGYSNGHANGNGYADGVKPPAPKPAFSITDVDYSVFHSPYGKMVQKGHARMYYNDFLANPSSERFANVPTPEVFASVPRAKSLTDKTLEKAFIAVAKADYDALVGPSMYCARRCGNMYTASLYGGLSSLVSAVEPEKLKGKRLSMYAFGSGCASSFFVIKVKGDTTEIRNKLDLFKRLDAMKVVPCQQYVDALAVSLYGRPEVWQC